MGGTAEHSERRAGGGGDEPCGILGSCSHVCGGSRSAACGEERVGFRSRAYGYHHRGAYCGGCGDGLRDDDTVFLSVGIGTGGEVYRQGVVCEGHCLR